MLSTKTFPTGRLFIIIMTWKQLEWPSIEEQLVWLVSIWRVHKTFKMASKMEYNVEVRNGSTDSLRSTQGLLGPPPQWVNPHSGESCHSGQGRGLPSQNNNPRFWFKPSCCLSLISFSKSMSELNPLPHFSDYRRRNNIWKGQVSLSLCEISQQFLEWKWYCL